MNETQWDLLHTPILLSMTEVHAVSGTVLAFKWGLSQTQLALSRLTQELGCIKTQRRLLRRQALRKTRLTELSSIRCHDFERATQLLNDISMPVQVTIPWEDLHQLGKLLPNFFTVGSAVINLVGTSIRMSQQILQ